MKRRHARSFLRDGLIRIGTLYDFRDEEQHGSEIGDKDEGTKTLTTDGYHYLDTADKSTIPSWYFEHFSNSFKIQTLSPGAPEVVASAASLKTTGPR